MFVSLTGVTACFLSFGASIITEFGSCVSPLSDVGSPVEQLTPRRSQSRQQAHQGNGPRGKPLLCYAFMSVKPKLTRKWVHRALVVVLGVSAGPEADREGDQESERNPGSEGERGPADSAPAGLRQRRHQPEQRRAHTGEAQSREFRMNWRAAT